MKNIYMSKMQNNFEPGMFDMAIEENDNMEENDVVVENIDDLDLESFAGNYTGLGRLNRLIFLADHCPAYKVDALKMALSHVQTTFNVGLYQKLHRKLQEGYSQDGAGGGNNFNLPDIAGGGQVGPTVRMPANVPQADMMWVETRSKKAALKLEKLDGELKASKVNSIKESIRRGHDDLGDHYLDCGDLPNALKCYSRSRDYCTTLSQVTNMCFNVIKVSIYLNNWSHVISYCSKANAAPEVDKPSTSTGGGASNNQVSTNKMSTNVNCAAGLAHFAVAKYKSAGNCFLNTRLDELKMPDILTPSNVAVYGGLCALATFSREELFTSVISSSSFKSFMELEPQLMDVIFKFYNSEYAACLKSLDSMMNFYLLDMFLSRHVKTLYSSIRNRALIQYFGPYQSADMEKMAGALNTSLTSLENELIELILEEQIHARIDSHNKILYANTVDERSGSFERALVMGRDYEMKSKCLLLRAALIRRQIHVRPPPRDNGYSQNNAGNDVPAGSNCTPMQSSSSNRS